jgi:aspartate/methionine/tyrosine aminotransferase
LVNIVEAKGCVVKKWALDFDNEFNADIDQLAQLVSSNTKAIIVNLPHNPTGVSVSAEQQQQILAIAAKADAYLLWDASFNDLCYDTEPLPEVTCQYDKAVSFGTFSKAFGLPGLRFGWAIGPEDVLQNCIILKDYTTLFLSPLIEHIAKRVIEKSDVVIANRFAQAKTNLALLEQWIEAHSDQVQWVKPQGGVTAFISIVGVTDVAVFCTDLLAQYGLLLVPGTCFYRQGYLRLGFGGSTTNLKAGLARLDIALNEFKRAKAS